MERERTAHVGMTRRVPMPGGGYTEISMNLSGIHPTDSESTIAALLANVTTAVTMMTDEIDRRIQDVTSGRRPAPARQPAGNLGAFVSTQEPYDPEKEAPKPVTETAPKTDLMEQLEQSIANLKAGRTEPSAQPAASAASADDDEYDPFAEDSPTPAILPVPKASAVTSGGIVFGIEIDEPPAEWHDQPLTTVNAETGEVGGQQKAINSALSAMGYSKGLRHPACLVILRSYGTIASQAPRAVVGSVNDLTKAEAHIILSYIEASEKSPSSLAMLAEAVRQETAK